MGMRVARKAPADLGLGMASAIGQLRVQLAAFDRPPGALALLARPRLLR